MPLDLEHVVDSEGLRFRFNWLRTPDERREFLRVVHSDQRLLGLWKALGVSSPCPPADPSEQAEDDRTKFAAMVDELDRANVQKLYEEKCGSVA